MGTYAAELYMPGTIPEQLLNTAPGSPYLSATSFPQTTPATACSAGPPSRQWDRPPDPAGIPYERIIPAVHLVTEDLP